MRARAPAVATAVICHPHPLQQGTMSNKVVTTRRARVRAAGRGRGALQLSRRRRIGRPYADGVGERDDALAVVAWCRARWPGRPLYLGGFSFGAAVAAAIAARAAPAGLVTVAPPVDRLPRDFVAPTLPVAARSTARPTTSCRRGPVLEWCATLPAPPRIVLLPGVGHFFHGQLGRLDRGRDRNIRRRLRALGVAPMLRKLAALFDGAFARDADDPDAREHALRVATALLLIEVAKADYADDFAEDEAMLASLKQFFALDDAAAALLLEEARSTADRAVELQQFTRRLHEQLSVAEKQRVVEMLWQVALADQRLDKHEDHLVRRIAELLYVSHSDLIRIRNRVRSNGAERERAHSSTKNCFLNRTVNRLGSLLGVASIV